MNLEQFDHIILIQRRGKLQFHLLIAKTSVCVCYLPQRSVSADNSISALWFLHMILNLIQYSCLIYTCTKWEVRGVSLLWGAYESYGFWKVSWGFKRFFRILGISLGLFRIHFVIYAIFLNIFPRYFGDFPKLKILDVFMEAYEIYLSDSPFITGAESLFIWSRPGLD